MFSRTESKHTMKNTPHQESVADLLAMNGTDHFEGSPLPPLLNHKHFDEPSVFTPENLLREARRQKGLTFGRVPTICVLDPDGDLVDHLHATGRAHRHPAWACYNTTLDTFVHEELKPGLISPVLLPPFPLRAPWELSSSRDH